MRVSFLHSLIRKEAKLLLDELTRHPEVEVVMLDDRGLIFDLQRAPEVDVVLERCINHSRAPRIIHLIEAPGFLADRDDPDSRVPHPDPRRARAARAGGRGPHAPAVVRELRQIGLMVGIELKQKAQPYLATLMEHGVFALPAGPTVIRLLPPLVITDEQLDTVADRVIAVLTDG
jgi:hypothetical protein